MFLFDCVMKNLGAGGVVFSFYFGFVNVGLTDTAVKHSK